MWNTASVDVAAADVSVERLGEIFGGVGAAVSTVGGRARNGKLQSENGWRLATRCDDEPLERHLARLWKVIRRSCPSGVAVELDAVVVTLTSWAANADDRQRTVLDPDWIEWLDASGGWLEHEHLGLGPPPSFRFAPDGCIDSDGA